MKIAPWTMFYLGATVLAGMAGMSFLKESPYFASNEAVLCFIGPFFFLFAAGNAYLGLSTRYSRSKDKLDWLTPIWSSSPLKNPQCDRLFQVLVFGAFGVIIVVMGISTKKNYEFGVLSLAMSMGILAGWLLFRLKSKSLESRVND